MGGSLRSIKQFPKEARTLAGREIRVVQRGGLPEDWKPMPTIGPGAIEIRIHEPHEHRVFYVAKFPEAVYILHVCEKKTNITPLKDLRKASATYAEMLQSRKN